MHKLGLAALAACVSSAALAQDYDGTYQLDSCSPVIPEMQVVVTGLQIDYYETSCTMSNAVRVRGMEEAFLFEADCSGEGEVWRERVFMMEYEGPDLLQVRRGQPYIYRLCP